MVKLAMIGVGGYAFELLKRMWTIPETIEFIGAANDPTEKCLGRKFCQEKKIPLYDTVDQLLKNVKGQADVIYVPTPIHTHYGLVKKCIEAGFNVWVEKPPVATIQDMDSLIELGKTHHQVIPVGFQGLYTTILQELKTRLVAGEFGQVQRVKGMAGWPRYDTYYERGWAGLLNINGDWVLDGTINNPLAHMLSNALFLASMKADVMAEPVTVEAELYHGHDIDSEDTSSLRIITTENTEVIFNASLCSSTEINPIMTVECENAVIEYENFNVATITFNDGRTDKIVDKSEQRVHMLTQMANHLEHGSHCAGAIEVCRPFTLAVNGAFESCGRPHDIDAKYINRFDHGDSIKTVIEGIDHVLKVAHANGRLFSELGVKWAKKSQKFSVEGYKNFTGDCFK